MDLATTGVDLIPAYNALVKAEEEMTRECEDLHDMIDYRCGDIEELSCILEEREELLEQVRDALSILKEIA